VVAVLTGLPLLLSLRSAGQAAPATAGAMDVVRRAAVATMFAVHTIRFGIYLRPDQGRRAMQSDVGPALAGPVPSDGQHQAVPRHARR